jgi:hypothetical protein
MKTVNQFLTNKLMFIASIYAIVFAYADNNSRWRAMWITRAIE